MPTNVKSFSKKIFFIRYATIAHTERTDIWSLILLALYCPFYEINLAIPVEHVALLSLLLHLIK